MDKTLLLTVPELECDARQWAMEFLHSRWETAAVVTDLQHVPAIGQCEQRNIILFERTPSQVLKYVLQNGGHPWLVSDIVGRVASGRSAL